MKAKTFSWVVWVLTFSGVLFSGYLSAVKFFTDTCALNEPCPYFLGYPACWYGFAMFLAMFLVLTISMVRKNVNTYVVSVIKWIALVGILFAGKFVYSDVTTWLASSRNYALILPSCVYGLIFYVAIFILSLVYLKKDKNR